MLFFIEMIIRGKENFLEDIALTLPLPRHLIVLCCWSGVIFKNTATHGLEWGDERWIAKVSELKMAQNLLEAF